MVGTDKYLPPECERRLLDAEARAEAALASQRYWSQEASRAADALSEAKEEIERLKHNLDVATQERDAAFDARDRAFAERERP